MRTFVQGDGADRKFVRIQVEGRRMVVTQAKADGTSKRSEKELNTEEEAASAGAKLASELISRGYVERAATAAKPAAKKAPAGARPAAKAATEAVDTNLALAEALEESAGPVAATLPRMSFAPVASGSAATKEKGASGRTEKDKKKKKKKGKKKGEPGGQKEDKLVIAGVVAMAAALVGLVGWFVYTEFLSPYSIVGTWQGSKLTYEIGHPIIHKFYHLILDDKHRAAMTFDKKLTFVGTYSVKGNKLKMHLASEELEMNLEYRFKLARVELSLFEQGQKESMVDMIRLRDMEKVPPPPKTRPRGVDAGDEDDMDSDDGPPGPPGAMPPQGAGVPGPPGNVPPGMPDDEGPDTDPE